MKKKKREQKVLRQQQILNAAKAEHRELTDEERKEFDQLQKEIETLDEEISAEETNGNTVQNENGESGREQGEAETPEQIRAAERGRMSEITNLCREFGMEDQLNGFISGGTSVEAVRQAVIDKLIRDRGPIGGSVSVERDEQDKFRCAAADAIVMRGGIELQHPAEGARELQGMSLRALAVECLEMEGQRGMNRRSGNELFDMMQRQFYNPTAAFPAILDNAINKAYVEGHRTAPATFDRWVKKGSLNDFKTHDNNYLSGPAGEFLEVPEGGEIKHDVWTDAKRPTRKLKTYGRQFTMTRQAFINDDIGVIVRMPAKYAESARKTQNKQCYQVLVGNPKIYDEKDLFGTEHNNLLAKGTGITREAVQGMILALSNQKDEFGEACIIRPATIIVPSGYQFDMYTMFFSPTISTEGNTQAVNPLYRYRESIEVVEDPTINVLCGGFGKTMPWWLLGSKADTDFMEIDYLNGEEIPKIRRSEQAGTLGYTWDVYLDWGISVMDFRGGIKNPGVIVKNPVEMA